MALKKWITVAISIAMAALVATVVLRENRGGVTRKQFVSDLQPLTIPDNGNDLRKQVNNLRKQISRLRSSKPYIVIDTHSNHLYLRTEDSIIINAICSTGSGGEVFDPTSGRKWRFETPRGIHKVESKMVDPWWRKPDWAFLEEDLPIPEDPRERLDSEMLGEYALGFGNGYFIHGTIYERLLGISVTHGCVRIGSQDLKRLYEKVKIGTEIYVF
ncbi:MAG: L,D-transpeptidase [bacterium]